MLTINRFCCMRLHTAGVVIGWVGGAFSLINVVINALILSGVDQIVKYIVDHKEPGSDISPGALRTFIVTAVAFYLTLSVVNLISSVLLVIGTMRERHLMLVPWLINYGCVVLVSALNFISATWLAIAGGSSVGSVIGFLMLAGLILATQYLIWTAIYSLFRTIRSSVEQQQLIPNKTESGYPSYTRI